MINDLPYYMRENKLIAHTLTLALLVFVITQTALCASASTLYVATDNTGDFICDGSADQGQINAAIDMASPNDIVYLRKGTYYITGAINLKSGVTLRGEGEENTKIEAASPDYFSEKYSAMIYFKGVSNAELYGLTVDGGVASLAVQHDTGGKDRESAIRVEDSTNCKIHDVYVTLINGDGVRGDDSSNIDVYNCQMMCSGHDGVQIWGGNKWHVYNCNMNLFVNSGVRLADTTNGIIEYCTFYSDTNSGFCGVELEDGVNGAVIKHNLFRNIHSKVGQGIATVHATGDVYIENNVFYDCPGGEMVLDGISARKDGNLIVDSLDGISGVGYDGAGASPSIDPIRKSTTTIVTPIMATNTTATVTTPVMNVTDPKLKEINITATMNGTVETSVGKYQPILAMTQSLSGVNMSSSVFWYYPSNHMAGLYGSNAADYAPMASQAVVVNPALFFT
jgi:hypothetical protein